MMLLTESKKQKMHRAAVADGGGEAGAGNGFEAIRLLSFGKPSRSACFDTQYTADFLRSDCRVETMKTTVMESDKLVAERSSI